MTHESHEPSIPATMVGLDPELDPVPAAIVTDKRSMRGRRLGSFAIVIILFFFAIGSFIQSSQNGRDLHDAHKDNHILIRVAHRLTKDGDKQNRLIHRLQIALAEQNKLLRKNNLSTVDIPGPSIQTIPVGPSNPGPSDVSPQPSPAPSNRPTAHPKPTHSHRPHPRPTPKPSKGVVDKTTKTICELTGVCLKGTPNDQKLQDVRRSQVHGADYSAGPWYFVFRSLADLGVV